MIQMRPSVAVSAVVNSIRQFYDVGSGVTQTTMLGASGSAPTLYEDFTTGQTLDPRITFTRASSATRFDSTGTLATMTSHEPRFDYDPVTLQPKGLLIEEQRTNLLFPSADFTGATWTKTNIAVGASTVTAPDGSLCYAYSSSDPASLVKRLRYNYSTTTTGAYTYSIFVRAGTEDTGAITLQDNTGANGAVVSVRFTDGVITVAASAFGTATGASATVQNAGGGFYRVALSCTFASALTQLQGILTWDINGASTSTGTLFPWGAQLEAGAFPTSYIPTTTAAAPRAADVATMTGTNFSSWYNQTEGTLFAEATPQASNVASCALFEVGDATVNNRIGLFKLVTSGNASLAVQVSNVGQASTNNGAWPTTGKFAGGYKVDDFASAINGGTPVTDSIGTVPSVTQATIGRRQDGASILNGHIKRIAYFPRRLANSELQAITA